MKIYIHQREKEPFSVYTYILSLKKLLIKNKVTLYDKNSFKKCEILWDPGLGMRFIPKILLLSNRNAVCTIHGLRAFSLPYKELPSTKEIFNKYLISLEWLYFKRKVKAIIAVSKFGADEIEKAIKIKREKIFPIYHGVDKNIFYKKKIKQRSKKYFLLVAQYQPKKNIDRTIEAYKQLPESDRPEFKLIIPGYNGKFIEKDIKGLTIINKGFTQKELSEFYNNAMAFVFPSLHETFGMPILEAMSCGCPVITSNVTACPEVAGDAALLVNPYSVEEIREAMERIIDDKHLREELSEKGIERAKQFTWEKSAQKHLEVFRKVLNGEI